MKRNITCIIYIILLTSCNDYFSDDFFEFLFNSKNINIKGECSDSPSLIGEGRFFEIYSMSEVDIELTVKNIFDKSNFTKSIEYPRYKIPKWKKTPINNETDSIYSFVHNEMRDKTNTCYDESSLNNILRQKNNYYAFLHDNLGRSKLFIWDVKNQKLFLLTTYEL